MGVTPLRCIDQGLAHIAIFCKLKMSQFRSQIWKSQKSQFRSQFWNQMLIMFYLSVFYQPCLKNLTKTEKNHEVCMWYAQMVYYHVFVPLLRLSNDVEENPGPRNKSPKRNERIVT